MLAYRLLTRDLEPSLRRQINYGNIMQLGGYSESHSASRTTTSLGYSYLAARFHKGGKGSQDEPSKAVARAKQAAIQRDHRSRRRAGETVSLTPTISQLGVLEDFEGPGEGILVLWP
ncbi:hypothetical protein BHE90_016282 [Fusarium euwallaceae]|uniref:Uncharacterized protein n=2 Tax=Fusarium solani species complex TaxID=232080 RepID=A0A3M2RDB7_9HYPO|nr:hypothetical protein CDV36_015168 [Fusarium kuroshium]RTE69338.1 hypothetical protein BHE90_016282 [Fusarium euwallaceae]